MAPLTRFGLRLPTVAVSDEREPVLEHLVRLATVAESSGFDSLWVPDRPAAVLAPGPGGAALEAHTALGALAVRTGRARLGTLVTPAGLRPPAILAKHVTTLDVLSGGRAVLGLGAGAQAAVHGGEAGPSEAAFEELEDALAICRAMFVEEAATVLGHRHRIAGAANRPRPVQPGGPPILVGGNGERRTLPLAVALADGCNLVGPPDVLVRKADVVRRLCEERGRAQASFTTTALVGAVFDTRPHDAAQLLDRWRVSARTAPTPWVVLGTPATVAAQLGEVLRRGVDGVVLDVPAGVDLDALSELGRALVDSYGPGPGPGPAPSAGARG